MFNNNEQLKTLSQAQFDKAVRLSNIVLASAERFANLHLELSKKLLADQAATTKALVELKDPKAVLEYQASLAQPGIDQAFSVARSVYDAALQTQTDIQSFVEEQVLEFNKQLCANLDKVSKNAPAGSEVAINAVKNMLTSATAAYDNVTRTAKKVGTELAEAGVEAAANSAKAASAAVARSAASAVDAKGVKVLAARLDGLDGKALLAMVDQLKNKLGSAVILLGGVFEDKVVLVAGVTQDLTAKLKAGDLMRQAAAAVGGKGGGRPDMAQAGGTQPEAVPAALQSVHSWLEERL